MTMHNRTLLSLFLAVVLAASIVRAQVSQPDLPPPPPSDLLEDTTALQLMGYVTGIEGQDHTGRRQFILDQLDAFGIRSTTMPFDTVMEHYGKMDTVHGVNIIVRLGKGTQKVVVGAHYDAVPGSPGANDNGSGVAVLLELVRTLSREKLPYTYDFCFFDREEIGLIGSAVYVQRYDTAYDHLAMINLDIEGSGNEVYVGPVDGNDDSLIVSYIHQARDSTRFPYYESDPYPSSDYSSFADARLENISISVVPSGDGKRLTRWMQTNFQKTERPEDYPVVLKTMHSPRDSSATVEPEALKMSYEFTLLTLRLLNDAASRQGNGTNGR